MWWKKHKWKVIVPAAAAAILIFTFWYGGNAPGARGWTAATPPPSASVTPTPISAAVTPTPVPAPEVTPSPPPELSAAPTQTPEPSAPPSPTPEPSAPAEEPSPTPAMSLDPETHMDKYQTDPVPEGKPLPVEPQDVALGENAYTCTISISCATILNNLDLCDPDKVELVPEDGWILEATQVTFYEGESVFNVLQRTCKQNRIHMEYEDTPIYNSAYIEGINNLYEFDVGDLSGWMYQVNGWFPNYGCSRYQLQDGDVVEWEYTCDLGDDVGGGQAARGS